MENLKFRHPVWVKLIGWIFLPVMFGISVWFMAIPLIYDQSDSVILLGTIPMGGFCLYMTVNGLMTLPFMNATIMVLSDGLKISNNSDIRTVKWSSIKKVNHVTSAQVLHLYDSAENRFLSVTEQITNYKLLVALINENTGLEV